MGVKSAVPTGILFLSRVPPAILNVSKPVLEMPSNTARLRPSIAPLEDQRRPRIEKGFDVWKFTVTLISFGRKRQPTGYTVLGARGVPGHVGTHSYTHVHVHCRV